MKAVVIIILCLITTGCSNSAPSHNQVVILDALYERHEQWRGTPYRLGGYSERGIDCSGFVALTFDQLFEVTLPRATKQQAAIDAEIPKTMIQPGDLVFFQIPGQKDYFHVGIYLEDENFLHASTSQGVMISNLQAQYWSDHYWKAIRVLP